MYTGSGRNGKIFFGNLLKNGLLMQLIKQRGENALFKEADMRDMQDTGLLRLGNAEREFIHALYLEHSPVLRRCAVRLGFPKDTADDLLQDTFLTAIRRVDTLRECQNQRAYLFQILRNVIGYRLRSAKYAAEILEKLRKDREKGADPAGYWDELSPELLYRGLIEEEELRLLLRVYLEGWPVKEAARELGIDPGACYMRLKRAREHLRAAMEKDGLR